MYIGTQNISNSLITFPKQFCTSNICPVKQPLPLCELYGVVPRVNDLQGGNDMHVEKYICTWKISAGVGALEMRGRPLIRRAACLEACLIADSRRGWSHLT